MGFRYRRSVNLGGARLNISKRGISSVSVGRRGATLNFGVKGVRSTIGLPGTGLSYRSGRSGNAGLIIGAILLIGVVVRMAAWLITEAVRGNRSAQVGLCALVVIGGYAYFTAPHTDASRPASTYVAPRASVPESSAAQASPPAASTLPANAMQTTTGANLRAQPSAQSRAVRQLDPRTPVSVIGGDGTWANVQLQDHTTGWVSWSLLARP